MTHYFVNTGVSRSAAATDGVGRYWRAAQTFRGWTQAGATYESIAANALPMSGRVRFQVNLNLLAQLIDGAPVNPMPGVARITAAIDYPLAHREDPAVAATDESVTIAVTPREFTGPTGLVLPLPIGRGLAAFLDDPLGLGEPLGLGLPFMDPDATVSQAWIRDGDRSGTMHGGFDFSVREAAGARRPLIAACAAEEGVVVMLINNGGKQGGVVLRHEPAPGVTYFTLYQHLRPGSVSLAVGQRVQRGERLGRIRRWIDNGNERSHLHFDVLVRAPVAVPGLNAASRPLFAIDPFGVYDDHVPDSGSDYAYVPRARGGMRSAIRGADRTIHWAGNPPIKAFSGELRTEYLHIRTLQARIRTRNAPSDPGEDTQFLVFLEGDSDFFFVRLKGARDLTMEVELMALLRDAFLHRKRVSLGFRHRVGGRYVSAAWVRA